MVVNVVPLTALECYFLVTFSALSSILREQTFSVVFHGSRHLSTSHKPIFPVLLSFSWLLLHIEAITYYCNFIL